MKLFATKSALNGHISIPGSKSHTIRAVAIASLAEGISSIQRPLISSDTVSAVECYSALGSRIDTKDKKNWVVEGTAGLVSVPAEPVDVGNSGTTLRIATGSAALSHASETIILTGDDQVRSRPIEPLLQALRDLGTDAKSFKDNGMAPISIQGRLKGGTTSIECITSQYLSSLLLACPLAEKNTVINVTLLNEPDYVQMTLDWLDKQHIRYENDNFQRFKVYGGQAYKGFEAAIPADFSSATFFLCAGAILNADITLEGLDFSDSQPDKAVVEYLKAMGADIKISETGVQVRQSQLKGIEIDMNRTPDALPAMAVTAAMAQGTTKLVNVAQARNKETDRITCMAEELGKLGIKTEELPDGLIVHGGKIQPAKLNGHHDHRIVMALSLAAMALKTGQIEIDTAQAINVTFPDYVELMNSIGAKIQTK